MAVTSTGDRSTGSATTALRTAWIRKRAKDVGFERLEDLADAVGITRPHLHKLLASEFLPNATTSRNLAAALRCLIEDLYEDSPSVVTQP